MDEDMWAYTMSLFNPVDTTLMEHSLIDEFRVNVNPILLGGGIPFLKDIKERTKLDLINAKTFQSSVIGLHYATK